jgi:flagellar basal-body rod protein FlgC
MSDSSIFSAIDLSATGLMAQRNRMNAIAQNIANSETTRTPEGGPYKRQITVLSELGRSNEFKTLFTGEKMKLMATQGDHLAPTYHHRDQELLKGVSAAQVQDQSPPRLVYNPDHPDANDEGYVEMPNVNIVTEMVDMIAASRAYEANVTVINAAKGMAQRALEI